MEILVLWFREVWLRFKLATIVLRKRELLQTATPLVAHLLNMPDQLSEIENVYRQGMHAAPTQGQRQQCLAIIQAAREARVAVEKLVDAIRALKQA
ncbi:MAG: hypothetical protein Q8R39_02105 [bacterium]|nr:hypothetical protein [bacterium]MDZ4284724.1 hypothetical protein [Patescibacteria group bacterium]